MTTLNISFNSYDTPSYFAGTLNRDDSDYNGQIAIYPGYETTLAEVRQEIYQDIMAHSDERHCTFNASDMEIRRAITNEFHNDDVAIDFNRMANGFEYAELSECDDDCELIYMHYTVSAAIAKTLV